MPNTQLEDVQKVSISITVNDYDADGNIIGLSAEKGKVSVVPDDPTKATYVPDATPAPGTSESGTIVGGKTVGTVTFAITGVKADGTTPWFTPISDALDIVTGPVSASVPSISLGVPVSQ